MQLCPASRKASSPLGYDSGGTCADVEGAERDRGTEGFVRGCLPTIYPDSYHVVKDIIMKFPNLFSRM